MKNEKVYAMSFAKVYPLLVNKAVRKGRTIDEVDRVIQWLTGYDPDGLKAPDCKIKLESKAKFGVVNKVGGPFLPVLTFSA